MPNYLNQVPAPPNTAAQLSLASPSPVSGVQPTNPTDVVIVSRMLAAAYVSFQITGSWTGTIGFEASNDNLSWFDIAVNQPNQQPGDPLVTSTNVNGLFWFFNTGFKSVRARCKVLANGTPLVTGIALPT